MITATHYTVEYDEARGAYKIRNMEAPVCPDCGLLLLWGGSMEAWGRFFCFRRSQSADRRY